MNRTQRVEVAAEGWRKALVDPSGRNRLLYYRDLKLGTLDLGAAARPPLQRLLNGKPGTQIRLSSLFPNSRKHQPEAESTIEDMVRRARAVSRKAVENFEERGVHTLFLAQGFATWTPKTSKAMPSAPVLLCAASLHRVGASELDFDFSLDGEWMVNEALLQHLAREFKVEISGEELLGTKLSDARLDREEVEEILDDLNARTGKVPGFELVPERLILGNFMYRKLPMVNDIQTNLEILAQHDLIAALAGDEEARQKLRRHHTVRVDPSQPDTISPTDEYLVLDADSTQNQAINAALGGESFVLQGPPGTGKSQTIANLISTMMARGRSVLFVAEKRAAIDAVVKRLSQVGLGHFVMDLHGGTVGRRKLARQLNETLSAIHGTPTVDQAELHQQVEMHRGELSGYSEALHSERRPWDLSFFEIHERLLRLTRSGTNPSAGLLRLALQIPPDAVRSLDATRMRLLRHDIANWSDLSAPFLSDRPSPWASADVTSQEQVLAAQSVIAELVPAVEEATVVSRDTIRELGIRDPRTVESWGRLLELCGEIATADDRPDPEPLNRRLDQLSQDLADMGEVRRDVQGTASECREKISEHNHLALARKADYRRQTEALEAQHQAAVGLERDLGPAEKGGLSLWGARVFSNRYKSAMKKAIRQARSPQLADREALELARESTRQAKAALNAMQEKWRAWERESDEQRRKLNESLESTLESLQVIELNMHETEDAQRQVRRRWEQTRQDADMWDQKASDRLDRWKRMGGKGEPRIPSRLARAESAFAGLAKRFSDVESVLPGHLMARLTIEEVENRTSALAYDLHLLNRFPELARLRRNIGQAGMGELLRLVEADQMQPSHLTTALEMTWLTAVRNQVLMEEPRLAAFSSSRQNRLVSDFKRSDALHVTQASARVRRRAAEHAVAVCNSHPEQSDLLRREAGKKTRHLPLRRLFERASDVLTAVKPCWAMSPLDVAQNLPARSLFDLVVFDEASQVLPCDAVSALLRGQRAVVAGDSRQLPPTTFFDGAGDIEEQSGEEDADTLTDYESILDVMGAMLTRRAITWHYRSRDERLITFSNNHIYHGGLTTFPGAAGDQCLNFELVEHRRGEPTDTRSNPTEVRRVVDLMIGHARARPEESLGVIAMGRYHSNRIEETLRRRLRKEQSDELEYFFREDAEERAFAKNLERVQGDERDAIILSIGYGKNSAGRLMYRFGPLNQKGGERRLNVAVTRARSRMTLVSSFSHAEMDPSRSSAEGVRKLYSYLKYAESGGLELSEAQESLHLNAFELDVLDRLANAGLEAIPQYGCSGYRIDFAIRHPNRPSRFVLAVEADGASYHSSHTARDRDRLRQEHLERLGWRFCRIWSTNWFNDHRREMDRVLAEYHRAIEGAGFSSDREEVEPPKESEPPDPAVAHAPMREGRPEVVPRLPIVEYHPQELAGLARWVMSDGLLRTDTQIFEEMFRELGYKRRGPRIKEALYQAIQDAKKRQ